MAVKIDAFTEAFDFDFSDIFHFRTTGGIDHKIKGENLRKDLGQVATFIRKSKPGWLWCDGSTISDIADPEYAELIAELKAEAGADTAHPYYHADADKAVLPDLRGAVARGVDATANRDKDGERKSGGYQVDKLRNHLHTTNIGSHTHGIWGYELGEPSGKIIDTAVTARQQEHEGRILETNIGNKTSGNPTANGAVENTVKNIALYYLIRY